MADRIRWLTHIPKRVALGYWPERYDTIPKAVRWFIKETGVPPMLVVSKREGWTIRQSVSMWSSKALDAGHRYFHATYGKKMGEAKYQEAVHLALLKQKADERKARKVKSRG